MTRLRVFVVDDHALVREGVKRVIETHPSLEFVGEAADGLEATERIPELRPDIAVIDVAMPGLDGIQTTRMLKRSCPAVKVIALTFHEERGILRELLDAGAAGYVLKKGSTDELVQAIRTVSGNGIYIDSRLVGSLVSSFVRDSNAGEVRRPQLTDRETRVLQRVAEGHTGKEIAAELKVSIKTVETYKSRAMTKLGLRHRADIVAYANRLGWLEK